MSTDRVLWGIILTGMRAFVYTCSLIPGILAIAFLNGHWASFVLAAVLSSTYYHFVMPEEPQ